MLKSIIEVAKISKRKKTKQNKKQPGGLRDPKYTAENFTTSPTHSPSLQKHWEEHYAFFFQFPLQKVSRINS